MKVVCCSANAHKCNITHSVEHVTELFFKNPFMFTTIFLSFLPTRVAYLHVCFWLVCADEINRCTPNINNYVSEHFKNI